MTMTNATLTQYVTIKDAATALSCAERTIQRLIYAGKLPHVKVGRAIRIPADALTLDALATA